MLMLNLILRACIQQVVHAGSLYVTTIISVLCRQGAQQPETADPRATVVHVPRDNSVLYKHRKNVSSSTSVGLSSSGYEKINLTTLLLSWPLIGEKMRHESSTSTSTFSKQSKATPLMVKNKYCPNWDNYWTPSNAPRQWLRTGETGRGTTLIEVKNNRLYFLKIFIWIWTTSDTYTLNTCIMQLTLILWKISKPRRWWL